ncbi:papain family cysteine protease [Pelomyxa schiedti]|nr:papain family cysteine protease [Pelomyxa schiedti]
MRSVGVLVVVAVCVSLVVGDADDGSFEAFYRANRRHEYAEGSDVYFYRKGVFYDNVKRIQQLNAEQTTTQYGLNDKFADVTQEEFVNKYLNPPMKAGTSPHSPVATTVLSSIPDAWDWTEHGAVTAVKDQGSCGTCWAFSTTGNIEGQWFLSRNALISLSEEMLSDCDNLDCGMFGGWPYTAYEWLIAHGGIMSEKDYPYCCGAGDCYPCMATGYNVSKCGPHWDLYCNQTWTDQHCEMGSDPSNWVASISNYTYIASDETVMANELYTRGPLSVLINAESLSFYRSGIWDPAVCPKDSLDHAVLLVGYGTENGTPYWRIKNSWGSRWGEDGYFRMVRGEGKCGVDQEVTSAIV